MVARLLWQLRVWRVRVVAESGRDYRRSILVGPVLLLCELLLMEFCEARAWQITLSPNESAVFVMRKRWWRCSVTKSHQSLK